MNDELITPQKKSQKDQINLNQANLNDLLAIMVKFNTAIELIESNLDSSKQGNIYEKLWTLVCIFGYCEQIPIEKYEYLAGSMNGNNLHPIGDLKDHLNNLLILSNGYGGASDLTFRNKTTGKYLFMTSKWFVSDASKFIDDYDISKILAVIQRIGKLYEDYEIGILCRNKIECQQVINNSQRTNDHLKNINYKILDLNDLEVGYQLLKAQLPILDFNNNKPPLILRFHQKLIVKKIFKQITVGNKIFLLACIPRSGKTYIVGGICLEHLLRFKKLSAVVISPVPSETLPQFTKDLFYRYREFDSLKIHYLEHGKELLKLKLNRNDNNIIVISKQLLGMYNKIIEDIEQIIGIVDYIFFDENHDGGTTDQSESILDNLVTIDTKEVFLTATYNKTLKKWKIPEENIYDWNIEDIKLCKTRDLAGLIARHGPLVMELLNDINKEAELKVYDKHPEMCIMTNQFDDDAYNQLSADIRETNYGISFKSLFAMNPTKDEFRHPNEVKIFLALISGSNKYKDYPHKNNSIFHRISQHSIKYGSRTTLCNDSFTLIGWYLNANGIDSNINALSKILERYAKNDHVLREFAFLALNNESNQNSDTKLTINAHTEKAKADGKRGLILLLGKKCNLGISIPLMDVVMLFNDSNSGDNTIQIMFRSMTEDECKKYAYVVELSFGRLLKTLSEISINQSLVTTQKIEYIVDSNLIHIDPDVIQTKQSKTDLINRLVCYWRAIPNNALDRLLKRFFKEVPTLELNDYKQLYKLFKPIKSKPLNTPKIPFDPNNFQALPSGQKITQVSEDISADLEDSEDISEDLEDSEENPEENPEVVEDTLEKRSLINDMLFSVIRLASIMTMNDEMYELSDILLRIEESPELKTIFDNQTMIWWSIKDIIIPLNEILRKYLTKDSITYLIISEIKMVVKTLKDDPQSLLNFIDTCLKPKSIEQKKFGEVFTPITTINDMLNDLDEHHKKMYHQSLFTMENYKCLDPANGMGNFIIVYYLRLMDGLKIKIPDEKTRKKHILEKMLYMSEINQKNVYLTKQILDPDNEYNLNLYCGDSLKLDPLNIWGVKIFDVIIGNPPYNAELKTKKGSAPSLYNLFIEYYIEKCRILTFIVPSRWFSSGKDLDSFRQMMLQRTDLVFIKHFEDASKIFGNQVEIKGGINYFIKNSECNTGVCNYNGKDINLSNYDVLLDLSFYELVDKILKYPSLSELCIGQSYSGITTTEKLSAQPFDSTYLKCYVSQHTANKFQLEGIVGYIEPNRFNQIRKTRKLNKFNKWKVITARTAYGACSGFANMFIGKPMELCNQSYILFEVAKEAEAISLLSYLKCKLPNVMLSLRKGSQDISPKTCKWIPLPPLDRMWTDESVAKYFELSESDIKLITDTKITYHGQNNKPVVEQELPVKKLNVPPLKLNINQPKLNLTKPKIKIV